MKISLRSSPLRFAFALLLGALSIHPAGSSAAPRPPLPPLPDVFPLYYESFDEPYVLDQADAEVSVPGVGNYEESWSGYAFQRSGTGLVPFAIAALSGAGGTNIASDTAGSLRFWLRPYWSSGAGTGGIAPVLTFYAASGGSALLCWSLEIAPDGSAISLVNETDSGPQTLLAASIDWNAGDSHLIALNFDASGTALYLDGQSAARGGPLTPVVPSVGQLILGSDLAGNASAGADFDEFYSFGSALTQPQLNAYCLFTTNEAALGPLSDALMQGMSQMNNIRSTNSVYDPNTSTPCNPGGAVYFTNFTASLQANGTTAISFVINGGTEGIFYDVYRITDLGGVLDPDNWTWVGQGLTCNAYTFSNQPAGQSFYKLVEPSLTSVWGWGNNTDGECNVPPPLTNAVAVAGGTNFSLALTANGAVVAWGANNHGQTSVPSGLSNVVAIAAGDYHGMALLTNGVCVEWGSYCNGTSTFAAVPSNAPYSNLIAIAGSVGHDIGLTRSNTVVTWGMTGDPANFVPAGLTNVRGFAAIGCGWEYNAAIFSNGVVKAWGYTNDNAIYGFLNVPANLTNVAALAVGPQHSLAITNGGRVVSWGFDNLNQTNVPAGLSNIVAVAASCDQSLALKSDGTVVVWGNTNPPEARPPTNLFGVKALTAGFQHDLAISSTSLQPLSIQPDPAFSLPGKNFIFSLAGVTDTNIHFQWQFAGTNITGATNATYTVSNAAAANNGTYTVTISNANGQVSRSRTLALAQGPQIAVVSPPAFGTNWFNTNLTLLVLATNIGQEIYAPHYQWLFNGASIPGATNGVYNVLPYGTNDGAYSVQVTNAVATNTLTWTLRFAQPGMVEAWGSDTCLESDRPSSLTNAVGLAAGEYQSVAVTDPGGVVQWGDYTDGTSFYSVTNTSHVTLPPANGVVAVAAGAGQALALLTNGMVTNWGLNGAYGNSVPVGLSNVYSISCGWYYDLALLTNGTVVGWGSNNPSIGYTPASIPTNLTNVTAISAGAYHALALQSNGKVVSWGYAPFDETNVPTGLSNVVAVAAGEYHNLALIGSNGMVYAWGRNNFGQCTVPAAASNNVLAIAAGDHHSVALKNDGTLVIWGENQASQSIVPSNAPTVFNADWQTPPNIDYVTNPPCAIKLIAAAGDHTLAGLFSPLIQYPVNPANDLLLIYNATSADSSNVCQYYRTNRPGVLSANCIGLACTNGEVSSALDFTNKIMLPLQNWLATNATKRPQYIVLFEDMPSRVDFSYDRGLTYSLQYSLHTYGTPTNSNWHPYLTAINMNGTGGVNDCIAYVNKLTNMAARGSHNHLFISASATGYNDSAWYIDYACSYQTPNVQHWYGALYPEATNAEFGITNATPGTLVVGTCGTNSFGIPNYSTYATNVVGYYTGGTDGAMSPEFYSFATNGTIQFKGNSGWFVMSTIDSFNGQRLPGGTGYQAGFLTWFASNAFGGTNYSNTPVGAACYVDEPSEGGHVTLVNYMGYWAAGKNFASGCWVSQILGEDGQSLVTRCQFVGDPFVKK